MRISIKKPLCIVPARGGSKRLLHKNITMLGGKPLLAWTIEAAVEAEIFDEVWISSEDQEILDIAGQWGGKPLLRPVELAGDHVTLVQLCLHVIRNFMDQGMDYTSFYVLCPTSPFRRSETIQIAWQMFNNSSADSLLSVIPLKHAIHSAMVQTKDGWLQPLFPIEFELPRQVLVPHYRPDGGHIIVNISEFFKTQAFLGSRTLAFPVPIEESVDIDESIDILWAEFLLDKGMVKK